MIRSPYVYIIVSIIEIQRLYRAILQSYRDIKTYNDNVQMLFTLRIISRYVLSPTRSIHIYNMYEKHKMLEIFGRAYKSKN